MLNFGFTFVPPNGVSQGGEPMFRPRFVLPAVVYVAAGRELNLFFNQAALVQDGVTTVTFAVDCAVGNIVEGAFRWTPAAGGVTESFTLYAVDQNGRSVGTVSTTLVSVADDAGPGAVGSERIMFIGDSVTAAQLYVTEVGDLITAGGGLTQIPVGIQGTSPDFHEGRTGRKFSFYAGATKPGFLFTVDESVITTNPSLLDEYNDVVSGYDFDFWEDRIDRFNEMFLTGDGLPASTGSLDRVSGSGDDPIAWTAVEAADQNPFWDGTRLNFRAYCDKYDQEYPDVVYLMLGINDIIIPGGLLTTDADITAITADVTTIIAGVQDSTYGFPHCKVVILVEPDGATLRAFGDDYTTTKDLVATRDGMRKLSVAIMTAFDAGAYDSSVTVCGVNLWVNKDHSYPETTRARSARDTRNITEYQNNFPHPGTIGHDEIADGAYSHLRAIQPVLENSLQASEDFDAGGTTYTADANITVAKNITAPDGGSDAFKFTVNATPLSPDPMVPIAFIGTGGSPTVTDGAAGRHIFSAFIEFGDVAAPISGHIYVMRVRNVTLATAHDITFWFTAGGTVNIAGETGTEDSGFREMVNLSGSYWRVWFEWNIPAAQAGDNWEADIIPIVGGEGVGWWATITHCQIEARTGQPGGYLEKA